MTQIYICQNQNQVPSYPQISGVRARINQHWSIYSGWLAHRFRSKLRPFAIALQGSESLMNLSRSKANHHSELLPGVP